MGTKLDFYSFVDFNCTSNLGFELAMMRVHEFSSPKSPHAIAKWALGKNASFFVPMVQFHAAIFQFLCAAIWNEILSISMLINGFPEQRALWPISHFTSEIDRNQKCIEIKCGAVDGSNLSFLKLENTNGDASSRCNAVFISSASTILVYRSEQIDGTFINQNSLIAVVYGARHAWDNASCSQMYQLCVWNLVVCSANGTRFNILNILSGLIYESDSIVAYAMCDVRAKNIRVFLWGDTRAHTYSESVAHVPVSYNEHHQR